MKPLVDGLYEEIVTEELEHELSLIDPKSKSLRKIDSNEAPVILSEYVRRILEKKLAEINENVSNNIERNDSEEHEKRSLVEQVNYVNNLIVSMTADADDSKDKISDAYEILRAILQNDSLIKTTGKNANGIIRPETSVATSSLFTNANREPSLATELAKEIATCDEIDIMVSFIRWSGLRLIYNELKQFTEAGKKLRVISTSYMGATELAAIQKLSELSNTEIRISYDSLHTRLHAKVYIFRRNTGYSTAYVGSSNLTQPAMTSGCEWNVKLTKADANELFSKVESSYNAIWNLDEYEVYTDDSRDKLREALKKQNGKAGSTEDNDKRFFYADIRPYPYQIAILNQLDADREIRGNFRNLVVAATGTGKTIIAAFDYKNQCTKNNKRPTLLFIAHRREILEQSRDCFREVLRDPNFGDLFVGNIVPKQDRHLFISVDMINSRDFFSKLPADYYEYIVFDECHHVPAKSYQNIINYFEPHILLGLTATPDRMDGEDILRFFDNRVSAEIPLAEAINRKLLCPFHYFGVSDCVDLDGLKWSRGGYDKSELENVYVYSHELATRRARLIVNSIRRYIADVDSIKGIAFCVSVDHAKFMAEQFNRMGFSAESLSGQSSETDRRKVREKLELGQLQFVCVVDLYNEGVDIKEVNTVLFLRPTESMTIFMQQLGRGLRLAEDKDCLTVLDFIGQSNKKYNFESKYKSLLKNSSLNLENEIWASFPNLPRGCYITLEEKAQDVILRNLKNNLLGKRRLLDKISSFEYETGLELTLANFLEYHSLIPRQLYSTKYKLTLFLAESMLGIKTMRTPYDKDIAKKFYRISSIDDIGFIDFFISQLKNPSANNMDDIRNSHYWKMMYGLIYEDKPLSIDDIVNRVTKYWKDNAFFVPELVELLEYNRNHITFVSKPLKTSYENSLRVYCHYTRRQALAVLDSWNISSEGVCSIKDKKTTCLFVTLNKSNNYYSPSTSYYDYSINDSHFHWQSQNATRPDKGVGQLYINHDAMEEHILLFVREQKEDDCGAVPYTFLGTVHYESHTGSKPMSIVWRLDEKIPADFLPITDQLGVS